MASEYHRSFHLSSNFFFSTPFLTYIQQCIHTVVHSRNMSCTDTRTQHLRFFILPCACYIYIDVAVPAVSFLRRFLYSDLQPLAELGIAPDPHPEGPSALPVEAPEDIRKELANDRRREGLRKATVLKKLPRLTEVRYIRTARQWEKLLFLEVAIH